MKREYMLAILLLCAVLIGNLCPSAVGAQGRPDLVWMRGAQGSNVNTVAYSPDGKLVASGSGDYGGVDRSIKVWRVSDGMLLHTFNHDSDIQSVLFTPDAKAVIAADAGRQVKVWRIEDSALLRTLNGFSGNILSLALSPDGATLAVGMDDNRVQLYRLADGVLLRTLTDHTASVYSVTFSPDGAFLLSASGLNGDLGVRIWRVSDGVLLRTITGPATSSGGYYQIAVTPDGSRLAVGIAHADTRVTNTIALYGLSDGAFAGWVHTATTLDSFTLSPAGASIAAVVGSTSVFGVGNYRMELHSLADGALLRAIPIPGSVGPKQAAYSPDGRTLLEGGDLDGSGLSLWNVGDGSLLRNIAAPYSGGGQAWKIAVSSDGRLIASAARPHGYIIVRRTTDGTVVSTLPDDQVASLAFSPDGMLLASADSNGIRLFRTSDFSFVRTFPNSTNDGSVAFSPDGRLLAGGSAAGTTLWRTSDGTVATNLDGHGYNLNSFSPDGRYLARSYSYSGNVQLIRTSDWAMVRSLNFNGVQSVAFAPDSRTLAIGGTEVSLWDVDSGVRRHTVPVTGWAKSVAFSPDGLVIAVADSGAPAGRLFLWSVQDGSLLFNYDKETGYGYSNDFWGGVQSVTYSPDNRFFYYGRGDGTVAAALNPYRNTIIANHGGNTGTVSVKVVSASDFPLAIGANVKLTAPGQSDIVGVPVKLENPYVLDVQFDLRGAPFGQRDVVITNADGSTRTYPQGFLVEAEKRPGLAIEFLGRTRFRANTDEKFSLICYNAGNNDAPNSTVWLTGIPKSVSWRITSELAPPPMLPNTPDINWNEVPYIFDPVGLTNATALTMTIPGSGVKIIDHVLNSTLHQSFNVCPFSDPNQNCPEWVQGLIRTIQSLAILLDNKDLEQIGNNLQNMWNALNGKSAEEAATPEPFDLVAALAGALHISEQQVKQLVSDIESQRAQDYEAEFATQCLGLNINIAIDPNELNGRTGFGVAQWVPSAQPLHYVVAFENTPTSSASAQIVTVTEHLDPTNVDTTTVNLGTITIEDKTVTPTAEVSLPVGKREFNADVNLRPGKNLLVHVHASLDLLTGELTWTFTSIDPATGLPLDPSDPNGFLAPGEEGSVLFSVLPKPGLPTGTVVTNQATIVFDANAPMDTNSWFNTLDNDKPVSSVKALARMQNSLSFPVSWQGSDVGSGLRDFTIYVSDNGGPYTVWLANTSDASATFIGVSGHTYAFKSQARDNVFNLEDDHAQPDTITTLPNVAQDVTAKVSITQGGYRLNRTTGRFVQTVTITNTSGSAITGPVSFVLDSLSSNAGLFNKTGNTVATSPAGSPYIDVQAGDLVAGASVTVTLEFTNPTRGAITYTPRVLAGSGSR